MKKKEFCIIANGEFLPAKLLNKIIINKTTIALDGAIDKLLPMNIIPDVLLGDFDSHQPQTLPSSVTIVNALDQNFTDLQKGIEYCDANGATNISIVCATGGSRMDHTLSNIRSLRRYYNPHRSIQIITATEIIEFIKDSNITITGNIGDKCAIMACPAAQFSSTGLQWNGDNTALEFGIFESTCNHLTATQATIRIRGEALIIAPLVIPFK